jgi:hypothetical protein
MDLAQAVIFYVGWFFFIGWGALLAAISAIAFGRDILPAAQPATVRTKQRGS